MSHLDSPKPTAPSSVHVDAPHKRRRWPATAWLVALMLGVATLLVYQPIADMPFFAEDPLDLGQVRNSDVADILSTNASQVYYRPLTFLLMKAAESPDSTFDPGPFHVAHLAAHALNVALLYLLVWRLTGQGAVALLAAVLFGVYPYSYGAVARTTPQQPFIVGGLLLSLLLYLHGRLSGRRRWLWASVAPLLVSFPILENALLFGLATAALEALVIIRRQVARWSLFPLVHAAAALPFAAIWLLIPKEASALQPLFDPRVGSLLIETAVWPLSVVVERIAGSAPFVQQQAGLILAIGTLTVLIVLYWRGRALAWLALPAALWIIGSLPVWLTRNYRYVEISPRVLYLAVPGIALAWAGLATLRFGRPRLTQAWRAVAYLAVGGIAAQGLAGLIALQNLYRHGSQLMWDILRIEEQAGDDARLLFLDVPDRFELRQRPWPTGWWGMLLAPVSVQMEAYSDLVSSISPETRSLSTPSASAAERENWPYRADFRGAIAAPGELYAAAGWANAVYRTRFYPDGAMSAEWVGTVGARAASGSVLARYADVAALTSVEARVEEDRVRVVLHWRGIGPAHPHDTIFVHLVGPSGLIAQADGDSLGGLIPLTSWRPGDAIEDVRYIPLPDGVEPGALRIAIGLYNRLSSERLAAAGADGSRLPDDALVAPVTQEGRP